MQRIETMGPNEYIQFKQGSRLSGQIKKTHRHRPDPLYTASNQRQRAYQLRPGITQVTGRMMCSVPHFSTITSSISGGTDATFIHGRSFISRPARCSGQPNYERINVYTSIQQVLNKWLTVDKLSNT